jgi:hypothetical protein
VVNASIHRPALDRQARPHSGGGGTRVPANYLRGETRRRAADQLGSDMGARPRWPSAAACQVLADRPRARRVLGRPGQAQPADAAHCAGSGAPSSSSTTVRNRRNTVADVRDPPATGSSHRGAERDGRRPRRPRTPALGPSRAGPARPHRRGGVRRTSRRLRRGQARGEAPTGSPQCACWPRRPGCVAGAA